jgi:putative flippase GtrA
MPTPEIPVGVSGPQGWLVTVARDQRVAFLAVGAVNAASGFFWFALFYWLVGQRYGYLTALALAHVTSVSCAFWLYRHLVFRVRGHVWRDLARFETVYLSAFAVNLLVLPVLVQIVHIPVLLSQFGIMFVTSLMSWLGHKNFSFSRADHT